MIIQQMQMKCSAIRTPLHSECTDLQREEVAMCLAWIGFHEDSGSNCAKSLLGASFNFSQRPETMAFCEDERMC